MRTHWYLGRTGWTHARLGEELLKSLWRSPHARHRATWRSCGLHLGTWRSCGLHGGTHPWGHPRGHPWRRGEARRRLGGPCQRLRASRWWSPLGGTHLGLHPLQDRALIALVRGRTALQGLPAHTLLPEIGLRYSPIITHIGLPSLLFEVVSSSRRHQFAPRWASISGVFQLSIDCAAPSSSRTRSRSAIRVSSDVSLA